MTIGAQAVGIAQGALDYAIGYVKERKQFGKAIADFQAIQFRFPQFIAGVHRAESDNLVGVGPLQADGVAVCRNDLRGRRGCAQHHAPVNSGLALALQQIIYGAIASAGNIIMSVKVFHGLVRNLGMKGVGVDVDVHG